MNDITQPLRLAIGSHIAGSGAGCAMNVISWENGDKTITDFPECSDRFLSWMVQGLNDSLCVDRISTEKLSFLCPECSQIVLDMGHRTVGTVNHNLNSVDAFLTYARIGLEYGNKHKSYVEMNLERLYKFLITRDFYEISLIPGMNKFVHEMARCPYDDIDSFQEYAIMSIQNTAAAWIHSTMQYSHGETVYSKNVHIDAVAEAIDKFYLYFGVESEVKIDPNVTQAAIEKMLVVTS